MDPKRVIVLGGSGSLGQVVCKTLGAQGARVALTYFQGEDAANAVARTMEGSVVRRLDLTDAQAIGPVVREMAEALGGLDALVSCATLVSTADSPAYDALGDVDEAGWDRLMAVNVRGAFFACQAAAPLMTKGGNLVLLGSIDGEKAVPTTAPYAISKGALTAGARALSKELGPKNIRVNVIAPGILEAGISRLVPEDLRGQYLKHSAQKRFGTLAEVAEVVSFFALENTYVTGQSVILDGGL